VKAERPERETFGENVGSLTREAFGLEVNHSGFHDLVRKAVSAGYDYEDLVDHFGEQLGAEARSIARGLISERDSQNDGGANA
jgi:hypothetical protein